jgi:hypothetical protein
MTVTAGAASVSGTLPSAQWSDTTGTGNGWSGTIAVSLFNYTGPWTTDTGTDALGATTSGVYTGTGDIYYTVTVSSCTFNASGSSLSLNYAGAETGTFNATLSLLQTTASTVGTHGITITWVQQSATATSCPYAANDAYGIQAGNFSATALTLADGNAGATITPATGTTSPNPAFVNATSSVTGGTPSAVGAAVKFLSAATSTGEGTYTVVPYATLTVDTSVWSATYSATVTYTIASGP